MTTARALFHQCRKAGIILTADGDRITFGTPRVWPFWERSCRRNRAFQMHRAGGR